MTKTKVVDLEKLKYFVVNNFSIYLNSFKIPNTTSNIKLEGQISQIEIGVSMIKWLGDEWVKLVVICSNTGSSKTLVFFFLCEM